MSKSKRPVAIAILAAVTGLVSDPARAATQTETLQSASALPAGVVAAPVPQPAALAATAPEPSPYTLRLQYTGEAWDNAEGGLHTGTPYLQNVDAQFAIDARKAFGWTGGRFFAEAFYNTARSLDTQYVGAAQDPSSIDTSGVKLFRLYQAYYEQQLDDTNVLVGIYDPQTDFANTKPMDVFFNGAYAWNTALDQSGQQGLNGPSNYPNTSAGIRVRQDIGKQWSVQATLLDGMADSAAHLQDNTYQLKSKFGVFGIAEVDYTPAPGTKLMAGYWGYTGKFTSQDEFAGNGTPRQTYGSDGGYVGAATRLYTIEGRRGIDGFLNVGLADSTVNAITRTVNAGVTVTGLFDFRPRDKLGFAISVAGDGAPYRSAQLQAGNSVRSTETNFEVTYRAQLFSWLTVQPDIQYWVNPGLNPVLKNDLLFGVHFELSHLFDL